MKKLTLGIMTAFIMFAFIPAQLSAATETPTAAVESTNPAESEVVIALKARLLEIKDMDKTDLNRTEKKELRKEVRAIKSELQAAGGGVYLSVGAIIIVLLLLILLL